MKKPKILKNSLRFVLFLLFSANLAFAEVSGGFVGFELGGGAGRAKSTMVTLDNNSRPTTIKFKSGFKTTYYGFTAGYKQFFTPYLGLRYYASINAFHFEVYPEACYGKSDTNCTHFGIQKTNILLNYGANVDFMGNFYSGESADFGGFVGFGIGGNSYMGKGFEQHEKIWLAIYNEIYQNNNNPKRFKLKKTGFDAWINAGLRTNFAKYHGIEVVAKVPLIKTTIIKDTYRNYIRGADGGGRTGDDKDYKIQTSIKADYTISIRYTVSF